MPQSAIVVEGLTQFRSALRRAQSSSPRLLTTALKAAGEPIVQEARTMSHGPTGRLEAGYRTQVRGTSGSIVNRVPYAGGAHWGRRGKWKGFAKYGVPGERLAGRAIDDQAEKTVLLIYEGLRDVVTIEGWAT